MPAFQIIVAVAVPVGGPEITLCRGTCTLELRVCVDAGGRLAATLNDVVTPHCTLPSDGTEIWSGRLVRDCGGWIVEIPDESDEPLRRLHATTLRPGDHLTLGCQFDGNVEFRVVQASRAIAAEDG